MIRLAGAFVCVALMSAGAGARESYEARPALLSPGGMVLFYNSQAPMSYNLYTRRDLSKDSVDKGAVSAQSCQFGLSIPIAATLRNSGNISGVVGDGGYAKALGELRRERKDITGIYDVKVDLHAMSVLGIFMKLCTEIHARAFAMSAEG